MVMHNKGHIRRKLRELPQDTPTPGNPISGATAGKFNCWGTREAQNPLHRRGSCSCGSKQRGGTWVATQKRAAAAMRKGRHYW